MTPLNSKRPVVIDESDVSATELESNKAVNKNKNKKKPPKKKQKSTKESQSAETESAFVTKAILRADSDDENEKVKSRRLTKEENEDLLAYYGEPTRKKTDVCSSVPYIMFQDMISYV
ncbi:uncharacterized protein MELLADRAFT_63928 [Melampsora larici-populina 98AG31]|uniref:Uncharacterized protein n=1 Tax=Melampsora larici-populina (strain 98AG31 / pathotype 3-4-7) TaxID=747676 RepID=F4RPI1_MELLP|nr:uncharacterized protein MELLADRAFT_63928 [Melampsora larici-populina 98AG31]EGG05716.1 hypothetical protein MELLADRAFT_63928 [Melampsora larici-populina 98AG31]